jgi:hypothetical protein
MEILTMDENLFESIYSQASAAREPMQEASLEDFVDRLADELFAKEIAILGEPNKENI